jgi:hypothetical protein
MTSAALHATVQRSRFAHHLMNAAAGLLPAVLVRWRHRAFAPVAALSTAEQAALEASRVREMAYAYSKTDPGFSADLYAAAARHEAQFED